MGLPLSLRKVLVSLDNLQIKYDKALRQDKYTYQQTFINPQWNESYRNNRNSGEMRFVIRTFNLLIVTTL